LRNLSSSSGVISSYSGAASAFPFLGGAAGGFLEAAA